MSYKKLTVKDLEKVLADLSNTNNFTMITSRKNLRLFRLAVLQEVRRMSI